MSQVFSNKKAIAIDGNSLLYRAYYATVKQLDYYKSNPDLIPVNAVKTMLIMVLKILKNNKYDYGLVAFDTGKPTFRKVAFEDYKANRKKAPDSLISQIALIKQALQYLGFKIISMDGYEADDLIGSFATIMSESKIFTHIYSSDQDLLQLVDENVSYCILKKGINDVINVDIKNFSNFFHGLLPKQVPEFKGIAGDSSDNYLGIKGIGKITAIKLLKEFGTLDEIYKNLLLIPSKIKVLFEKNYDQVFKYVELATIRRDLFANEKIQNFILNEINKEKITMFFKEYHINNMEKYLY